MANNEWRKILAKHFRDQRAPQDVRFDFEKRTGMLLTLQAQATPLLYAARYASSYEALHGQVELRFKAVGLYSLTFQAARASDQIGHLPPAKGSKFAEVGILDEPRFQADADKLFAVWTRGLNATEAPETAASLEGPEYQALVQAAVDWDAKQAAFREDEGVIDQARQNVFAALRSGKGFASAHHEGNIRIQLKGDVLVKRETGEWNSVESFPTEQEIFSFLRKYFDFEACRDTSPHKPHEVEIWKYIHSRLI